MPGILGSIPAMAEWSISAIPAMSPALVLADDAFVGSARSADADCWELQALTENSANRPSAGPVIKLDVRIMEVPFRTRQWDQPRRGGDPKSGSVLTRLATVPCGWANQPGSE